MKKLLSLIVFMGVVLVETTGAVYSLNNSLGQQSNLQIIERLYPKYQDNITASAIDNSTPTENVVETNSNNGCLANITKTPSNSIIDVLAQRGKANTFEARKELARQYGIDNYVGSAEQNLQLINYLNNQQVCFKYLRFIG